MKFRTARGIVERGVLAGNTFDKYGSPNVIVKWLMKKFESTMFDFVQTVSPETINDIGCGEGYWVLCWNKRGVKARGCDFSLQVIQIARENAQANGLSPALFKQRSIYDLDEQQDKADLVVCCEVLEHLEDPGAGLRALQRVAGRYLIVSVPREPVWRLLNMARCKYINELGNTPGHIQHWSKSSFIGFVSECFTVVEAKSPLPWTMLLCRPRD